MKIMLVILLLAMCTPAAGNTEGTRDTTLPLVVLNMRGDSVVLADKAFAGRTFIIFYNAYSCRDCFLELVEGLRRAGMDSTDRLQVLLRSENNIFARRAAIEETRGIFPKNTSFYFDARPDDIHDPVPPVGLQGGLFGALDISRTPALIIAGNFLPDGWTFLPYSELFPPGAKDDPVEHLTKSVNSRLQPHSAP